VFGCNCVVSVHRSFDFDDILAYLNNLCNSGVKHTDVNSLCTLSFVYVYHLCGCCISICISAKCLSLAKTEMSALL